LVYGFKGCARIENAAATGTEDVPRHIENAESRGVQKSSDHILFIQSMLGGERKGIDAAKLTVRSVPDEFFDRTHRFRLCRLSQGIEQSVGFTANFHGTFGSIAVNSYPVAKKTESK
jgi:hypothetical protein